MAGWTEGEARARNGLSQCHTGGLVTCHVTPARPGGGTWGRVKYIAYPVLVNKGWGMGVVKYIACARCGLSYYLPTPAHPVQVNNGVWLNT